MFTQNKNGLHIYKEEKRIRGFITPLEGGRFAYAFGKPSDVMSIMFECQTLENAKKSFLSVVKGY